jgi:hypothetical protein
MSDWLGYDDFVELVRDRHLEGFSGLITGVSYNRHSFQIGFDKGKIVLLTYRIKKGQSALRLLTQVERVKVSEYPNADKPDGHDYSLEDTGTVIARLVARTSDDTTTITRLDEKSIAAEATDITIPGMLDENMRSAIESAAREHFGPIGEMICAEQLDAAQGDIRSIMLSIAHKVDANEEDTRAFLESVSVSKA